MINTIKFLSLVVLAISTPQTAAVSSPITPIPLMIALEPSLDKVSSFEGNDKYHVVYELFVNNFTNKTIRINSLIIKGIQYNCHENKRLVFKQTIFGQNLANIFSKIGDNYSIAHTPLLGPAESGVLFVFVDFDSKDKVPDKIENTITAQVEGQAATVQSIVSRPIFVGGSTISLDPPLKGQYWFAFAGPDNFSRHRRELLVLNGSPKIAQRFAVDWIKYGPNNSLFSGDPSLNTSYFAYGEKVFSASHGVVVETLDEMRDNTPGVLPPLKNLSEIGGNFILVKADSHHYIYYAHLTPRSQRVKKGDRVYPGQWLANLGNSGNSDAPHLHFHVSTRPLPLAGTKEILPLNAQGLPWSLNHWIRVDYIPHGSFQGDENVPLTITPLEGVKVRRQITMDSNLAKFPKTKDP